MQISGITAIALVTLITGTGSVQDQLAGEVRWERAGAPCSALYDRLVAKGKTPKLALIAVANKLLNQAFAIANSRVPYDPEHVSVRR